MEAPRAVGTVFPHLIGAEASFRDAPDTRPEGAQGGTNVPKRREHHAG
jgi:hypothetical protein